jgi:hypothetical protein
VLCIWSAEASAGQRPYAFVQGADSLPQTSLELESWFGATRASTSASNVWDWWLGPVVGVTDRLELALYAIFLQLPADNDLSLRSFRLQGSYLLADRGSWPVDIRLRVEIGQPVGEHPYTGWFWLIAARDFGRLNLTANASFWLSFPTATTDFEQYVDYFAGASWQLLPGVRIGAELQGEAELGSDGNPATLAVGPSLAAGTGRIWAAASYDFALAHGSPSMGRLVMGLAF